MNFKKETITELENQYDKHVFVCINSRTDSQRSSCGNNGFLLREEIIKILRKYNNRKLKIRINKSGCLDQCECGPTIVIYPKGFWYYNVTLIDINEIVQESIINNNYIQRLAKKEK